MCAICTDWRFKQETFQRLVEATGGHGIACHCDLCEDKMRARSPHLAALNRRDFYCEASWHAAGCAEGDSSMREAIGPAGSGMGGRFMQWVNGQISGRQEGWWVITAPYRSMGAWLGEFARAAAASGIGVGPIVRVVSRRL